MLATIATTEVADLPRGHQTADRLDRLRRAGWSLLPSGLKTTMRTNWTEWHAVREYVQNALDETGAVEVALDQLGGEPVTFIRDAGRGFYAASLRVGQQKGLDTESTEEARARALREQLCLRGRFGEGMKLATLPVLRSGGAILIRTKGMDATFCIGDLVILPGSPPAVELFLAVRANAVTQGTAVALVGVDHTRLKISATEEPRLVDRVVPLLVARDPGTVVATVRGVQPSIGERETSALPASAQACRTRQLLGTKPGRIFVRDIFVEDSKLNWAYSWNFWFDDAVAALGSDRDRFQLDATDIQLGREILAVANALPTTAKEARQQGVVLSKVEFLRRIAEKAADGGRVVEWSAFQAAVASAAYRAPGYFPIGTEGTVTATPVVQEWYEAATVALGTDRFSTSRGESSARRALEHASVKDVTDQLPGALAECFITAGLIRSPESYIALAGLNRSARVTAKDLERFLKQATAMPAHIAELPIAGYGVGTFGARRTEQNKDLLKAFATVERGLTTFTERLWAAARRSLAAGYRHFGWRAVPPEEPPRVLIYIGDGGQDDRDVAGFWDPKTRTVNLRITSVVFGASGALPLYIHEMAHALFNGKDLTEEHVSGFELLGSVLASLSRGDRTACTNFVEALDALRQAAGQTVPAAEKPYVRYSYIEAQDWSKYGPDGPEPKWYDVSLHYEQLFDGRLHTFLAKPGGT